MQSWLKSRGLYGGSTFCRGCYSGVLPLVGGRWCWPGVWVQLVLLEVAGLIQRFYEHEAVFIDTEGGVGNCCRGSRTNLDIGEKLQCRCLPSYVGKLRRPQAPSA